MAGNSLKSLKILDKLVNIPYQARTTAWKLISEVAKTELAQNSAYYYFLSRYLRSKLNEIFTKF